MVILDIRTRWNLTFDMLVRANELKEVNLFLFTFVRAYSPVALFQSYTSFPNGWCLEITINY